MARATITIDVHNTSDCAESRSWFHQWERSLVRVSENSGCGCCVEIYDVEGPQEAIDAIPQQLRTHSEWVETGRGFGGTAVEQA